MGTFDMSLMTVSSVDKILFVITIKDTRKG